MSITWTNWAGSLTAAPSQLLHPASASDLQSIVLNNRGKTIRAAGTGHSWSPLVPTGDVLVDMSNVVGDGGRKAWRWQQGGRDLVTLVPSARWADVRDALTDPSVGVPRMYLPTAGVVPSINATGFLAAGCHGTGWMQLTVSDLIHEIQIIGADGKVHVFSEDSTPDEMPAVRVNLGTLGLISQVTLNVEPMYNLWDQELVLETSSVMGPNPSNAGGVVDPSKLSALVTENDYVELFWFPWSGSGILHPTSLDDGFIWAKLWNRTTDLPRNIPPQPPDWQNFFAELVMGLVAEHPRAYSLIPPVEWGLWQTLRTSIETVASTNGFIAEAPVVLHYQSQAFPVIDIEIAIPIPSKGPRSWDFTNIVKAWYQVVNLVCPDYPNQIYPLTVCMHARFIKNSQALLSPATEAAGSNTHYCWIEVLSAYPKAVPDPQKRQQLIADFTNLLNAIAPLWVDQMKGRPHWAKYWQDIPNINIRSRYPQNNIARFNQLRSAMDPNGMFLNTFLKGLNMWA
jgi:D-arabinono-1,4-lactone oxidase/FAD binding domain